MSDRTSGDMNDNSSAYWEGAARGVLVLQQCRTCGMVQHYPKLLCGNCQSWDLQPRESTGSGTVYSWTVTHHAFDPSVADRVPYTMVTVDITEGVRVLGQFPSQATPPVIGEPLQLRFTDGVLPIPTFVRTSSQPKQSSREDHG